MDGFKAGDPCGISVGDRVTLAPRILAGTPSRLLWMFQYRVVQIIPGNTSVDELVQVERIRDGKIG